MGFLATADLLMGAGNVVDVVMEDYGTQPPEPETFSTAGNAPQAGHFAKEITPVFLSGSTAKRTLLTKATEQRSTIVSS